jgi:hypothetical protein
VHQSSFMYLFLYGVFTATVGLCDRMIQSLANIEMERMLKGERVT